MISLKLSNLSHEFEDRIVFSGLCFEFSGTSLAVTGPNGSGKTTLLKLLAGLLTPTSGGAHIRLDDRTVRRGDLCDLVGYAGPDARLYPEMTPRENLRFIAKARCLPEPDACIDAALRQVKLESRADDLISALSSGLSQRASLAAAILHSPRVLLLDEPSTGLDEHGIETLHSIVGEQARSGMVVIATNDPTEAGLAAERIQLG